MREYEITVLQNPRSTTDAGVTGGWTDMQGYLMGNREVKVVLFGGAGTTAGAISGSVQSAEDTSGTGASTLKTFTGLTSAGGLEVGHGVIPAAHRYVRFLGGVETGKNMLVSALIQGVARVSP